MASVVIAAPLARLGLIAPGECPQGARRSHPLPIPYPVAGAVSRSHVLVEERPDRPGGALRGRRAGTGGRRRGPRAAARRGCARRGCGRCRAARSGRGRPPPPGSAGYAMQPRQARPARDGVELVGVAEGARRAPQARLGVGGEHARLARGPPARDVRDREREQPRVVVARRRPQHQRGHRARRHAADARAPSRTARAAARARASGARPPAPGRRPTSSRARRRARGRARRAGRARRPPGRPCAAAAAGAASRRSRARRRRSARARRRARANGPHMSRCAPMPLMSSSGGPAPRRATRSRSPPAVT